MTNDITAGGGRPVSDASFQCILESKYAVINILRPLSECEKLLLAARLQRRLMTAEVRGTIIMEAGVRMCPVIVSTNTGPDMSAMFDNAQWASPLLVAWTEPFLQIYTNIFKIHQNI